MSNPNLRACYFRIPLSKETYDTFLERSNHIWKLSTSSSMWHDFQVTLCSLEFLQNHIIIWHPTENHWCLLYLLMCKCLFMINLPVGLRTQAWKLSPPNDPSHPFPQGHAFLQQYPSEPHQLHFPWVKLQCAQQFWSWFSKSKPMEWKEGIKSLLWAQISIKTTAIAFPLLQITFSQLDKYFLNLRLNLRY